MFHKTTVYWRSDTRPPEEIMFTGFHSGKEALSKRWWKCAIRNISDQDYPVFDSNHFSVSLSSNLASAPLFPIECPQVSENNSYLYAMILPISFKINMEKELSNKNKATLHNCDYKNILIDLHSYQVDNTRSNMRRMSLSLSMTSFSNAALSVCAIFPL